MAFCNLCVTVFREEFFSKSGSWTVIGGDGIGFKGQFSIGQFRSGGKVRSFFSVRWLC